jgi:hypothetical protein
VVAIAASGFVLSEFASSYSLKFSLNWLWGMINSLQLIVHMPALNVQYPANAGLYSGYLIDVTTFDFLQTDEFFPQLFLFNDKQDGGASGAHPLNDRLDTIDYGFTSVIMNTGTVFLIILLVLVKMILV